MTQMGTESKKTFQVEKEDEFKLSGKRNRKTAPKMTELTEKAFALTPKYLHPRPSSAEPRITMHDGPE